MIVNETNHLKTADFQGSDGTPMKDDECKSEESSMEGWNRRAPSFLKAGL